MRRANGTMLALCLLLASAFPAGAQIVTEPKTDRLPAQLSDVAIHQRLDQQVPLAATFRDENGKLVHLGAYFTPGRPVILSLVYYRCPMLCDQVLSSMASTLRLLKFQPGEDFEVVSVSFDPRETPEMAAAAKSKYIGLYGKPSAAAGWHFLTGDQASIHALSDAVGFQFRWDERTQQFAHATGIMLLTPQGRVSQYYYGARYFPSDLRLGLVQSSQNHIGTLADEIVLYCYHYDPRTGRYGAIVSRVIQVSGGLTLLILGSIIVFLMKSDPNRKLRHAAMAGAGPVRRTR